MFIQYMGANPPKEVTVIDLSDYQGGLECINLQAMWDGGVRIIIIKITQGTAHLQKKWLEVYTAARAMGFLVTFYHFCDNQNAIAQANWFLSNVGSNEIDLPLMLDVEAYTPTFSKDMYGWSGEDVMPFLPFRYGITEKHDPNLVNTYQQVYSYEYPQEAIVWVIADRIKDFQGKGPCIIYSNQSSASKSLTDKSWIKHPLYLASWNAAPYVFNPWRAANVPEELWQMGVFNMFGQNYDCGRWNEEKYPIPWGTTPSPEVVTADVVFHDNKRNKLFAGTAILNEVKN